MIVAYPTLPKPDDIKAIRQACARCDNETPAEDILGALEAGKMFMARITEADEPIGIAVFEHSGRFLHVVTCAGEHILEHIDEIVTYWYHLARVFNHTGLSLRGRKN